MIGSRTGSRWRFAAAVLMLLSGASVSAPRIPASDAEILEHLPASGRSSRERRELERLREQVRLSPADPVAAGALAEAYFDLAMAEGDPRYVGYAEGVLAGWRDRTDAPAKILLLQGLLRQYRHDFDGALTLLARAAARSPQLPEPVAWRAAILLVRADYPGARAACRQLDAIASELLATGCRASVDAMTGRAGAAYDMLAAALARHPGKAPGLRLWAETRLAEFSLRSGRVAQAETHFRAALDYGMVDNYLLAAYSDFLLAQRRPVEVLALLKGRERSDTLLLRIALAEKEMRTPTADAKARTLGERFRESALRGERLHLAEESRYLLALRADARGALKAAVENWTSQREPRDAEVLLEAALAAREPASAAPVLAWLKSSGCEEPRLRLLAETLAQLPG